MSALADLLAPDNDDESPSLANPFLGATAEDTTHDLDHPGQREGPTARNRALAAGLAHDTWQGIDRYRAAATNERPVEHNAEGLVADTEVQGQFNTATNLMLGGRGVAGAVPGLAKDAEGAAGVFVGRKGGERLGKGLEREVAEGLYKQGFPIEDVRRQTGWSHGPRGPEDWQYEISDRPMVFKPNAMVDDGNGGRTSTHLTFGENVHHPEFLTAYPEASSLGLSADTNPMRRPGGQFDGEGRHISVTGMDRREAYEILAHELQHASDYFERKPGGSSPKWTRGVIETQILKELPPEEQAIYHALSEKEKNDIAYRRYRHDAGEVNAEITKNRLNLNPEQRLEREPRLDMPKDIDPNLITLGRASASYGSSEPAFGQAVKPEMAIKGYHGSPHDFDKFSMDKIGTGEGAQAYGHGLYFAENEGVARSYRDALSDKPSRYLRIDGRDIALRSEEGRAADIAHMMQTYDIDPKTPNGRDWLDRELGARGRGDLEPKVLEFLQHPIEEGYTKGRMYEVEIDAKPEQFLDYDAPLSAQPEAVRRVLGDTGDPRHLRPKDRDLAHIVDRALKDAESPDEVGLIVDNDSDLYKKAWDYARRTLSPEQLKTAEALDQSVGGFVADQAKDYLSALSKRNVSGDELLKLYRGKEPELAKAGVPGVKYRDANSRGTNEGSRNYVTFSDDIVKILRKYGVAGLAMLPPAVQATLLDGGQEKP